MDLATVALLAAIICLGILILRQRAMLSASLAPLLEEKHRAMLRDLHDELTKLGGGMRDVLSAELKSTRADMQALRLDVTEHLGTMRLQIMDRLRDTLTEQSRNQQELIQVTMRNATDQLTASIGQLTTRVDERLELIGNKVGERVEEGFKKTNEAYASMLKSLGTIETAQEKLEGLSKELVNLHELLDDKTARGAFGEVQLELLVRDMLPPSSYEMQHTLPNGARVDCALFLPEPTGTVAVDSKFPLENFRRMYQKDLGEADRAAASRAFKLNVRKHVDDIADKYIIAGHTSDGAVMFLPAEAVFADIHAYHPDLVSYAQQRRVWLVSPSTLMAVLNTARAVLKDVETRRQVHIIKDELGKLGKEFERFDKRMGNLATHIRQAHDDVQEVQVTSQKISNRFARIENVELEGDPRVLPVPEAE